MAKSLGWRSAIALLVVFLAFIYLMPTLPINLPAWWSTILPEDEIRLGLDLQGGMHLILEVQSLEAVESHLERVVEELKMDLRSKKIRYMEIRRQGVEGVIITLIRASDDADFEEMIEDGYTDFELHTLPDDGERPSYRLALLPKAMGRVKKEAVDQALETIRNRVDQFGVSEPDIRPQSDDRILIQLPGIEDPQRAMDLIGKTALLEFKLVDEENSPEAALAGNIPPGDEILYLFSTDADGKLRKVPYLLKKRTVLTGEYITDARVRRDNQYNEPYVYLTFNSKGAKLFERITAENKGKRLAIILDNKVYSAPVIKDRIAGGSAQITGRFTMDEARDLKIVLRAGALPASVKIIEERTVGPSLGRDSIEKGFKSMLIGGLIVLIFMVIYYGLSGIIADLALFLNILIIMAGLALFGATLTLPGIAGVILTIGMAVDANVLIFERIREEMRLGKTMLASIEGGYSKALVTILDANLTTMIVALVLLQFGTGPVKGFAVTLSIGILASFFTAIFVTRIIFDFFYVKLRMKRISI